MANTAVIDLSNQSFLRQTIMDTIQTIETVLTDIHVVLVDISGLVQDIDIITEKLENKYQNRLKRPAIFLDANRNQCDVIETSCVSSQSKSMLPSPYMDYTYLDLTKDCESCSENMHNFTYNEKYPLWIQYDTWRTGHTNSDISEVTAGSDSINLIYSGSDGDTCSKSWRSISNIGEKTDHVKRNLNLKEISNNNVVGIAQLSKCCKSGNDINDKYCGVYEQMMEQQLDDIEPVWHDLTGYDTEDSFSDEFTDNESDSNSHCSVSLSDEHVIRYNKDRKSWIAFKITDVTVRECSDSISTSSME